MAASPLVVLCVDLDPFLLRMVRACHPEADVRVADDPTSLLQHLARGPDVIVHLSSGPLATTLASAEVDERVVAIVDPTGEPSASSAAQVLLRPVEGQQLRLAMDRAAGRRGRTTDRIVARLDAFETTWPPRQVFALLRVIVMLVLAGDVAAMLVAGSGSPSTVQLVLLAALLVHGGLRLRFDWLRPSLITGDAVVASAVAGLGVGVSSSAGFLLLLLAAAAFGFVGPTSGHVGVAMVTLVAGVLATLLPGPDTALVATTMLLCLAAASLGTILARVASDHRLRGRRALADVHAALVDLHRHAQANPDRLNATVLRQRILDAVRDELGADRVALASGSPETWQRPLVRGCPPTTAPSGTVVRDHVVGLQYAATTDDPVLAALVGGGPCVAAAPMRAEEMLIGVLVVAWDRPGSRSAVHRSVRRLGETAAEAAIALDNAELFAAVDHLSVSGERRRIARDLHDGIVQSFVHVGLELDRLSRDLADVDLPTALEVMRLRLVVGETVEDTRSVIGRLRSRHLDEGLHAALETLVREHRSSDGPEVSLHWDLPEDPPTELATELFRIAQESLANARQHAQARTVTIEVTHDQATVHLVVSDDGVGIDPVAGTGPLRGTGLPAMRERLALLGGSLDVQPSADGHGTVVRATLPAALAVGDRDEPAGDRVRA